MTGVIDLNGKSIRNPKPSSFNNTTKSDLDTLLKENRLMSIPESNIFHQHMQQIIPLDSLGKLKKSDYDTLKTDFKNRGFNHQDFAEFSARQKKNI